MRKLGYFSLSSLVFSLVVLWLASSHVDAIAPVMGNKTKPTDTGSDTSATGSAEEVLVEPGRTDLTIGGEIGEDRMLGFGVRLARLQDPSAGGGGGSKDDGQSGALEDVLISSEFIPMRRESISLPSSTKTYCRSTETG
jgi:hypothetical protein